MCWSKFVPWGFPSLNMKMKYINRPPLFRASSYLYKWVWKMLYLKRQKKYREIISCCIFFSPETLIINTVGVPVSKWKMAVNFQFMMWRAGNSGCAGNWLGQAATIHYLGCGDNLKEPHHSRERTNWRRGAWLRKGPLSMENNSTWEICSRKKIWHNFSSCLKQLWIRRPLITCSHKMLS